MNKSIAIAVAFAVGAAIAVALGLFEVSARREPMVLGVGVAIILGWLAFGRWAARARIHDLWVAAFGVVTGLINASVSWAVASQFGTIRPTWDGEICQVMGLREGVITWPVIGLVACLVYRRTNSTLAMSGATLLLIAAAFWSELTLNGRCH